MTRTIRRPFAVLAVAAAAVSIAAPALAASAPGSQSVTVQLASLPPGSRQFYVEDVAGSPLTAINFGTQGRQPFRVRVVDSDYSSVALGYQVEAKMTNLYKLNGASPDYSAPAVPSSALSLEYGTTPLAALGVKVGTIPQVDITGTLASCTSMLSNPTLASTLGLTGTLGVLNPISDPAVAAFCAAVTAALPVTATADGVLRQVDPAISNLTDLPTALSGNQAGSFSSPDYSAGVGANDPNKPASPPSATALTVMHGTSNVTSSVVTNAVATALAAAGSLPLVSPTGAGALTTVDNALSALFLSGNAAVSAAATTIGGLTSAQQLAVLNQLTGTLVSPVLAQLSGSYYSFPILHAAPSAGSVQGTYQGTMTVTYVQQ